MLSLERLEAITDRPPQRIGLSATQRPLDEIAVPRRARRDGRPSGHDRRRRLRKPLDVEVIVPVDDMNEPGASAASSTVAGGARTRRP